MQRYIWFVFATLLLWSCNSGTSEEKGGTEETKKQVVNVYSHRHYPSDVELFKKFTAKTGIEVNVIKANADELLQKIETEGENSPADVLLTVDAGRLYRAKAKNILQPIVSATIAKNVPTAFMDTDKQWVGLTTRARLIVYSKERVSAEDLSSMEALTEAKWKGKVLVRSSNNIYNQSLLASMIFNDGEEKAKEWAEGIVANMARNPSGSDRDQMREIVKGTGDVAIVNSYYVGLLLNDSKPENVEVGKKMGVFFPNQEGKGTHINISGAGLVKYSPNKVNAIKFLEFLTSIEAQEVFASANHEYPVNPNVKLTGLLESWGTFKADTTNFSKIGELNTKAVQVFDQAGWK